MFSFENMILLLYIWGFWYWILGKGKTLFLIDIYETHDLKGIVLWDFEVSFLVPFDRSDIATPNGMCFFVKIKLILCRIFFSGFDDESLP
jgi:hypothetical protein